MWRPVSGLAVAASEAEPRLTGLVTAHSLSKRSGAPGLRCGFLSGDRDGPERGRGPAALRWRRICPYRCRRPACACWRTRITSRPTAPSIARTWRWPKSTFAAPSAGGHRPAASSPGWMSANRASARARRRRGALWLEAGIRTLPGAYMSLADRPPEENPGRRYLRIALVDTPDLLDSALARIAETLL